MIFLPHIVNKIVATRFSQLSHCIVSCGTRILYRNVSRWIVQRIVEKSMCKVYQNIEGGQHCFSPIWISSLFARFNWSIFHLLQSDESNRSNQCNGTFRRTIVNTVCYLGRISEHTISIGFWTQCRICTIGSTKVGCLQGWWTNHGRSMLCYVM